jgi:hypothetical protein
MTNEHVVGVTLLKNIGNICTSNDRDKVILLYLPIRNTPEVSILGEEEAFFCYPDRLKYGNNSLFTKASWFLLGCKEIIAA